MENSNHSSYFENRQPNPNLKIGKNKFEKHQPVEPIPGAGGTDSDISPDDPNCEEVDYIQKGIELGLTNTNDVIIELDIKQVLIDNPELIPLVVEFIKQNVKSKK